METCGACGGVNPAGARFCNACGVALVLPQGVEVRRVCSMVFCDLAGFTARSDQLDPEDVRGFLVPYYELVQTEVARHGGVVDKLVGDGALAVFGASVAYEDHAERAVRASLAILRELPSLGLGLHARVGIESGEVVVSAGHSDRGDALTGDTVNTASRIQSLADTDTVVVGRTTYELTAQVFEYQLLDPVQVKGKDAPVALFRPLRPRTRTPGGDRTPFVGRQGELDRLVEWFDSAVEQGRPLVVSVVAEPGMGKSRLLRELRRGLTRRAAGDESRSVTWREGRCLPYGEGVTFWALSEIVKSHAAILDSDPAPTVAAKLQAVLAGEDLGEPTRRWLADRLSPLVGLAPGSAEPPEQAELFTAWRRFLTLVAREGPAVVVVEDLHWADADLVAFLQSVRDSADEVPLLVVVTARPEVDRSHLDWLDDATIRLHQLAPDAMRALVTATLHDPSDDLVDTVLDRAGGSPLFAEQLAAMRADGAPPSPDAVEGAVPTSLQALLAARLDALGPQLKTVLQDAAVVGRQFWDGAVAALGDRDPHATAHDLKELTRLAFLQEVPTSSIEDQTEYAFVHALVRDVAYAELSRRPRADKHRATAAWITDHVAHPLGPVALIVVHHLDQAHQAYTAAGLSDDAELIDAELIEPLRQAGDHAALTDMARAATLHTRALDLVSHDDPRRPDLLLAAGTSTNLSSVDTRAVDWLEQAADAFRAAQRWNDLGLALEQLGHARSTLLDDAPGGLAGLAAAVEELTPHPGEGLRHVLTSAAVNEMTAGDEATGRVRVERAVDSYRQAGLPVPGRLTEMRGMVLLDHDDLAGFEVMRQAYQQCVAEGSLLEAATVLNDLASCRTWSDPATAVAEIDEAIALGTRVGAEPEFGTTIRYGCLHALGRWDELLAEAQRSLCVLDAAGDIWTGDTVRLWLYTTAVHRDREALDLVDPAWLSSRTAARNPRKALWAATVQVELHRALGQTCDLAVVEPLCTSDVTMKLIPWFVETLVDSGASDLAEALFANLEPTSAQQRFAYRRGRALLDQAHERLEPAAAAFAELLAASPTQGAYYEAMDAFHLGTSLVTLDRPDEARVHLDAARARWQQMGAHRRVTEVDEVLDRLR